ncbi:MAG: PEGA domain-containing protein [Pontiella sp.]
MSGEISVTSDPKNADIYLNSVLVVGQSPKVFKHLPPGEYTVELRKEGYARSYQTVALLEGRKASIEMQLNRTTGLLLVKSDPVGSEVVINSEVLGTTPLLITKLPLGTYDVTIRAVGQPELNRHVVLANRKPVELTVQHPPRVAVNSYPPGAEILVDGEFKGLAPLVLDDIAMGFHKITAQLEQHDSLEQSIELGSGLNDTVEFNLTKNSGTLVIDTEPALVQVFINGTLFATTQPKDGVGSISQPLRIALKADREHRIQLVRNGYSSASLRVQTAIDQIVTKHEVLKRIFVYDTQITTQNEVIKCRLEYKLPNGNIYYERYPGVYNTARAEEIIEVKAIALEDESNRDARRLMEQSNIMLP